MSTNYLKLANANKYIIGGGPSDEVPSLATDNLEVTVTIRENDDPFGVFTFAESSREISIAEDFTEGRKNTTEAKLVVKRLQGTFNTVKVKEFYFFFYNEKCFNAV